MTSTLTNFLQTLRITPSTVKNTSIIQTAHVIFPTKNSIEDNNNNTDNCLSAASELQEISLSEVAMHDSYDDCWIVIYDRIYDVTNFLDSHPGGADVIMDHAGRDATLAFHGTGHSKDAIQQMQQFIIGELPEKERIFRTPNLNILTIDIPE